MKITIFNMNTKENGSLSTKFHFDATYKHMYTKINMFSIHAKENCPFGFEILWQGAVCPLTEGSNFKNVFAGDRHR